MFFSIISGSRVVAYDTSLNIGLIVDGTGHALALQVLRERKKTIINGKKR
jgi:hypothetical protein